jgi:DNA adenine methylase
MVLSEIHKQPMGRTKPDSMRPPLKWAGGKRWLTPHLKQIWQGHSQKRLVEPFCGGLAVVLGLQPERALLNDINNHAINFYRWLQKGLKIEIEMRNDRLFYYEQRSRFNELVEDGKEDSQEAAALFYYLNRTGYNGLCRFNKKGRFNVPFGRYARINYLDDFSKYAAVMQNWHLSNSDFAQLNVGANDFIYADPPYDVEFTQYAKEGFVWQDQLRLAQWLASHRGPVVVSNQATERIISLYTDLDFKIELLKAPRMISCNGDRTPTMEILATKGI